MRNAIKNGFVLSVVGAILVGGVLGYVIFARQGSSTASRSTTAPTKQLQVSLRRGIYPTLGLVLEQPTSWLVAAQAGLLTLSSPDAGLTSVAISAPAPAGQEAKLRPEINTQLVKAFTPAKVLSQKRGPIGRTPAITTAILGTSRAKRQVLILSTAVSSKYRTYSIQVLFKAPRPSRQSVLEVRNMLASMRFVAPSA